MEQVAMEQKAHLHLVILDRQRLAFISQAAIRAKANQEPLKFVSLQADAAAQTVFVLPMCSPVTHGIDKGYAERKNIMAVLVEGQFVEFFLAPQTVGGGSNLICTSIHRALTRLFDTHCSAGTPAYIDELYAQLDNCVGENKNNIVLTYLGSLVARGKIGRVEVNFMMVGHTHTMIDQVFSRIAVHCKGSCLFTRQQQAEAFSVAYTSLPVYTTTLRSLGNFKGALTDGGRVFPTVGITSPRSFEIRPAGPAQVSVGMKQYMHKPDFTGMTAPGVFEGPPHSLFRAGVPDMELAPPFNVKVVDAVARACVLARYNAVHSRLASFYPLDLERQETIKNEMTTSHRLLGAKGSVPWNLPCHWLRRNDVQPAQGGAAKEDTGTDEYSPGDGSSRELGTSVHDTSGGVVQYSGVCGQGGAGTSGGAVPGKQPGIPSFVKEDLVFFLAGEAPFLVGKVIDVRETVGSEADVQVCWWSPATSKARSGAAECSIREYGKGKLTEDYRTTESCDKAGVDTTTKKRKLAPDVEWMASDLVTASCRRLNSGAKIPKGVLDGIIDAKSQQEKSK